MRLIAGLATASLFGLATHFVQNSATAHTRQLETSTMAATSAVVLRSSNALREAADARAAANREWLRVGAGNQLLMIPKDVCQRSSGFDLLVHFHGVPVSTEPSVRRTNLDAVVSIVNWGIGSGAYEDRFQWAGAFPAFLQGIERSVQRACGSTPGGVQRIALSAWSAGYGAIYRILMQDKNAARVDSVLLADGLHTNYVRYHNVNPLQMEGYAKFADLALGGEKLFAISHSEVKPYTYASTEETAEYLLDHASLTRTSLDEPGSRPKWRLTSKADQNGFHVRGFAGEGKKDHANHLHGIGDTLWTHLRDRWAKTE